MDLWVAMEAVGRALQVVGVLVLLWGVQHTRVALGGQPLTDRALRPLRRVWRRLLRRPPVKVEARATISGVGSMSARAIVKPGWDKLSLSESVKRLQEISDQHEEQLSKVESRLDKEVRDRQQADEEESAERARIQDELQGSIRKAAATGLTAEWAGTSLVLLGLVMAELARWLG